MGRFQAALASRGLPPELIAALSLVFGDGIRDVLVGAIAERRPSAADAGKDLGVVELVLWHELFGDDHLANVTEGARVGGVFEVLPDVGEGLAMWNRAVGGFE